MESKKTDKYVKATVSRLKQKPQELDQLVDEVKHAFHTIEHNLADLNAMHLASPQSSRLALHVERITADVKAVKSDIGKPGKEKDVKAGLRQIETTLKQLDLATITLPEKEALEARITDLGGQIAYLREWAMSVPELSQLLGIDESTTVSEPPVLLDLVEPNVYEVKEIKKVVASPQKNTIMLDGGRRNAFRFNDSGNELHEVERVGKVRVKLNSDEGEGLGNVPFRITAGGDNGQRVTLSSGYTNADGYAALNLDSYERQHARNMAIEVDHTGPRDDDDGYRFEIEEAHFATHKAHGFAHNVYLAKDLIATLKRVKYRNPRNTIADPDAKDLENSPESFRFGSELKDGNCCLKPEPELAARQYHFRQIVRIDEPKLVMRSETVDGRKEVSAPVPYGDENRGLYNVVGANIIRGKVMLYRQAWYPNGNGVGRVLYSLALAPCEEVNLAIIDWSRRQIDSRTESRSQFESFDHQLSHDRSVSEVVESVLEEEQSGRSGGGGGGLSFSLGPISFGGGGGGAASSSEATRELAASTVQEISDNVSQKANAFRSQRATVVTTSYQRESERIKTRTVRNHNRNHAMTVQYSQVLAHHRVRTELIEEQDVLLIPYAIDQDIFDSLSTFNKFKNNPSQPITRFLDKHKRVLKRLVPRKYRDCFDSLERLLHCRDIYKIEEPYATTSTWEIELDKAWRKGIEFEIQTSDGQSIPLQPKNTSVKSQAVFYSNRTRVADIRSIRISFDTQASAKDFAKSFSMFGINFGDDAFESAMKHKLEGCEISIRTDRSRFMPETQWYRLNVQNVNTELTEDNPAVTLNITPPVIDFDGYIGRHHRDFCKLKLLVSYIQSNPMRILRMIWLREDPNRRALRFDRLLFNGKSLFDQIRNKPVGVQGNYVAFPVVQGHKLVPHVELGDIISERLISLPTRGVFAEVFLSCCNATEQRDVTRFVDEKTACKSEAPDITGITPGSRRSQLDTTPTPFANPMVQIQNAPGVPDPSAMANALKVMGTPNIFRDMSLGSEMMNFVNNATLGSMQMSMHKQQIMADMVKSLLGALTGAPMSGGSGGGGSVPKLSNPGVGSGGSEKSGSGSAPSMQKPSNNSGSIKATTNPGLLMAQSEMLRQTSPEQLFDHGQALQAMHGSGLINDDQLGQFTNALYTGAPGEEFVLANYPTSGSGGLAEPISRPCCGLFDSHILVGSNIVEMSDLKTHNYDGTSRSSEKSGLIYTCKGGIIDIGHLRDLADWTAYLAAKAFAMLEKGGTITLSPEAGTRTVKFKAFGKKPTQILAATVGQRIAYELAVWHELVTWHTQNLQRFSSFSPEDNFSNLLGTYVGADAILASGAYDAEVVKSITTRLTALTPLSKADSEKAIKAVDGRWWDSSKMGPSMDWVLRRHMEPYGTVTPWLVPGQVACPNPTASELDVPDSVLYYGPRTLGQFFELSITPVTGTGRGTVDAAMLPAGKTTVTSADFPTMVNWVKAKAKTVFGADADKP